MCTKIIILLFFNKVKAKMNIHANFKPNATIAPTSSTFIVYFAYISCLNSHVAAYCEADNVACARLLPQFVESARG